MGIPIISDPDLVLIFHINPVKDMQKIDRNIVNTNILVINVLRRFISVFWIRKDKPFAGVLNPLYNAIIRLYEKSDLLFNGI